MLNRDEKTTPLSRTDILFAIVIGLLALALYIRTLAPSLLWGDSAEFQTLSYTLGVTHPTGYATQIMFGKLFTLIPVNNIAYRVNLMSAFFGALAVACTYAIVVLLTGSRIAAISAAMLLAFTEGFWWRALVAESYAPAAGMLAAVWLLFLLWRKTGNSLYLFLAGLGGALSIGIHSTVVMTAAAVLIVMAFTARKRSEWISAAAGALLGILFFLGFFLFLDAHDPPSSVYNSVFRIHLSTVGLAPGDFDTPIERFLYIFPAGNFWEYYFSAAPEELSRRLVEYVSYFPIWALILILFGAVALFFRDRWRDGLYPLIAFLFIWGFAISVSFSVYREFYVPIFVITSVWFGVGAAELLSVVNALLKQNQLAGRVARIGISSLLIILPIWNARRDLSLAIRNGYTTFVRDNHVYPIFAPDKAIRDARKIINRVEENAIVFADWDKLYSYIYTAHIEEGKTGISFHEAWIGDDQILSETVLQYIDANIDDRPIYFTLDMPGLADRYQVTLINDTLYRIYRK
jgi:transmembrane protein TMEM260 (protein O-mannosyltransferase)